VNENKKINKNNGTKISNRGIPKFILIFRYEMAATENVNSIPLRNNIILDEV
jgi:hypothetical protein